MLKNTASQSVALFAFDTTTGAPKTGDAANMVFYVTKDFGSVTAIAAASGVPTEMDATNAKGWYKIAVSQTETNADNLQFTGKSSTANVSVVGRPVDTFPPLFTTFLVDSNGRVDVIKLAGTTQTARDIGASVIAASVTGNLSGSVASLAANAIASGAFTAGAINASALNADTGLKPIRSSTATAGAATTITLDGSASAVDGFYVNDIILTTGGTGIGQARVITAYVGATKVATVATWTTNPDNTTTFAILPFGLIGTSQTGDAFARLGAPAGASTAADIAAVKTDTAAVKVQTDKLAFSVTNQVDANVLDWKSSTAPAMTGDAFARLGAPVGASISADIAASAASSDLTATVADSIAADGSRPSVRQAVLMITRFLFERSVTTTTMTVTKEDGTTAVMTFTLNDGTAPTSLTRAS